jgi:hypothetical protein
MRVLYSRPGYDTVVSFTAWVYDLVLPAGKKVFPVGEEELKIKRAK